MKYFIFSCLCLLITTTSLRAQSFIGYSHSGNELVGGIFSNPANIAGSRYKTDINIFSVNVMAANNAIEWNLFGKYDNYSLMNNTDSKDMFGNVDLLMPSFMIALGDKQSIGFTSRFRFLFSENGMNDELLQLLSNKVAFDLNNLYNIPATRVNAHGFMDFGASYARILFQNEDHLLKAGVTAKYYLGLAAGSVQLDGSFRMINDSTFSSANGRVTAIYSGGIDALFNNDVSLSNVANGFGVDLGLVYEWKRPASNNWQTPYYLRVGLSVFDWGSLKYKASLNAAIYSIEIPDNVNINDIIGNISDFNSPSEYLDYLISKGYFKDGSDISDFTMDLPTYLRANIDANVYGPFFVNLMIGVNLKSNNSYGAAYSDIYTLSPRWESKYISLYMPVSYSPLKQTMWGIGVNAKYFFIGSGNIFSCLLSSKVNTADVYLGVHIPLGDKWSAAYKKKHTVE